MKHRPSNPDEGAALTRGGRLRALGRAAASGLVAAAIVLGAGHSTRAEEPPPRPAKTLELAFTTSLLSSLHKVVSDIETEGHQGFVGLGVAGTVTHLGPLSVGASFFAARSHGDDPSFVQLELGALVGLDIGREGEAVGVGLRVHPVWAWWLTDLGRTDRAPGPASVIEELPQLTLLIGRERTWIELAGGGAANGLDPRIGRLTVHWLSDAGHDRFELGLALLNAPFVGERDARPDYVYIGITGAWWHALSDDVGVSLAADLAPPSYGLRVALTHTLPL